MKFYCSYFMLAWIVCKCCCTTTKYYTFEEDAPGTEIGNLSRDLKIDPAEDPETSFKYMQKTNSVILMRKTDGLLTVGETIDREQLCHRSPQCLISFDIVAFSKEKFQLIHVEIEVKDINDHSPRFIREETHLDLSEDTPLNSRFQLDIAVDHDVGDNYVQSYHISHTSQFAVEVSTLEDGVKSAELVLIKTLDRETKDFYTIEVTATDGGMLPKSGTTTVNIRVLDSNDNSPTFEHSSLKVELREDSLIGSRVLKVHAFDPDAGINGEVVYGFVEGSPTEVTRVFQIDLISGEVTLKDFVDHEKKRLYELHIQASDLGPNSVSSTCRAVVAIIDVNDNTPEITIKPMTSTSDGVAFITEAAAEESFVALISTSDKDSGSNGYVRTTLQGHDHFKLQQAYSDTFMIVTTTTLDRETISEYNLTVISEDLGTPPFKTFKQYTIRITDENDNAPLFSKDVYDVSVVENNVPGSYITTVVARDLDIGKNGKVSYSLVDSKTPDGSPISTFVSVDPLSGSLYSLRSFNFEALKEVEFAVKANDKGSPPLSSTTLIKVHVVDENDNYPYFTYPVLRNNSADIPIPLNAQGGCLALQVTAQDEDVGANSELSFHIVQGDPQLFAINKKTGEIVLKQSLTASCGDILQIEVSVVDNGREPLSSTATVRFVVTDTRSQEDQVVILLRSKEEENLNFDVWTVIIVAFSGGCVLLLVAIAILTVTCQICRRRRNFSRDGLYGSTPLSKNNTANSNVYGDPNGFLGNEGGSMHHCLYEDKSLDFEEKLFLPCKPFEQTFLWQDEKYCLQRSGTSNTDQLSVKDSGKGDSDFNDSDSDTSGSALKRGLITFQPVARSSFNSAGDWKGKQHVIPTQNMHVSPGSAYTTGFSPAPIYNTTHINAHPWKEGHDNTLKSSSPLQTFSRTGALPSYSTHHMRGIITRVEEQTETVRDALLVTTASEVATTF
ncbi:protocadherin-8-like [Myxocyprinus asiaticus]|uniref:protocadherin-8-like n=1 Tax=Myxocyprinus asiaticus TaxID=70543 RepID=UPI00222369A4|nr:protocadherin-8-like [Myxocyprinus asiaticus]